jgi:hypothetical protein
VGYIAFLLRARVARLGLHGNTMFPWSFLKLILGRISELVDATMESIRVSLDSSNEDDQEFGATDAALLYAALMDVHTAVEKGDLRLFPVRPP